MTLAARLTSVRDRIARACERGGRTAGAVALVAVSKGQPAELVRQACQLGQTVFGENRVQELLAKVDALADQRVEWHMIGSLQTNKVKDLLIVPGLGCVQSLDRRKLADALQGRLAAPGSGRARLPCLIEVNASGDATKGGVAPAGALELLRHVQAECPALAVEGLMAIGPLAGDPAPVFAAVARLRDELRQRSGLPLPTLSLGMSGDFEAAIAAGSTMVRIGSELFGPRDGSPPPT